LKLAIKKEELLNESKRSNLIAAEISKASIFKELTSLPKEASKPIILNETKRMTPTITKIETEKITIPKKEVSKAPAKKSLPEKYAKFIPDIKEIVKPLKEVSISKRPNIEKPIKSELMLPIIKSKEQ